MKLLKKTLSLCPECLEFLPAEIFESEGKVWIRKKCDRHGEFLDLYFGNYDMYKKNIKFAHDGKGIENPNVDYENPICPKSCGLCSMHKTHTALGNIVVTNRCDLQCFYCFFYAKAMGYVYEPSHEEIRQMLKSMRQEKPVHAEALQLTGGEPLLREDLLDIIKMAKQEGYEHVQLNTNGIRLAYNPELVKKISNLGVHTLYLSFDGVSKKTNPKNHWEIPRIMENCRKAGVGIVLVPTVINTVNDGEVGNILKFGLQHIDIVRSVNYQPVSLVGRITKADVKKYRITIPDVIQRLEETGLVSKEDFYPISTVTPFTHFVEALTGLPKYELSTHPVCGMATYLFKDGEKIIPITSFVDVPGLMEYLDEKAMDIKKGKNKVVTAVKILARLNSFIEKKKQPSYLNFGKMLFDILTKGNYRSLSVMHHKTMFIGLMHFMDLYNYDIQRVKRCCIHYAQLDGTIVPFCAFNVIPEWYRDKIQKKFSVPIVEWERKAGRELHTDFYKRDAEALASEEVYKKIYEGFI